MISPFWGENGNNSIHLSDEVFSGEISDVYYNEVNEDQQVDKDKFIEFG